MPQLYQQWDYYDWNALLGQWFEPLSALSSPTTLITFSPHPFPSPLITCSLHPFPSPSLSSPHHPHHFLTSSPLITSSPSSLPHIVSPHLLTTLHYLILISSLTPITSSPPLILPHHFLTSSHYLPHPAQPHHCLQTHGRMQRPSTYLQMLLGTLGNGAYFNGAWLRSDYDFCSTHHRKPLPGTAQTLALFVTDLSMNLQPGTIQAYISAGSFQKQLLPLSFQSAYLFAQLFCSMK